MPPALAEPAARRRPPIPGRGKAHPFPGGKRNRKIRRDTINSISKGDIRRLARRGGVKRISADIYHDVRQALKSRLEMIVRDCCVFVEHRQAKTITVSDVIFALRRLGRPIYGFDPDTYTEGKKGPGGAKR